MQSTVGTVLRFIVANLSCEKMCCRQHTFEWMNEYQPNMWMPHGIQIRNVLELNSNRDHFGIQTWKKNSYVDLRVTVRCLNFIEHNTHTNNGVDLWLNTKAKNKMRSFPFLIKRLVFLVVSFNLNRIAKHEFNSNS